MGLSGFGLCRACAPCCSGYLPATVVLLLVSEVHLPCDFHRRMKTPPFVSVLAARHVLAIISFLVVWPAVPGSSLLPRFQVLAHCPFPPPHGDHAPQRGELHFPRALLVWPAGVAPCFWIGPLLGEVFVQRDE